MSAPVSEDKAITLKWVKSFNRIPTETPVTARLLCFHWAGGNGMAFRPWSLLFAPVGIDVLAMHCPGRLQRSKEPLVNNIPDIVVNVYKSLKLQGFLDSDIPLLFFGHSLGGIIAFELTKYIEEHHTHHPSALCHLVLSSINSPSVLLHKYADPASDEPKKHLLGDEQFIADMNALGGTEGVAPELIKMALPIMRADFTALETFRPQPWAEDEELYGFLHGTVPAEHQCSTPMTVLGGHSDHFVTAAASLDWYRFLKGGPSDAAAVEEILKPAIGESTTDIPVNIPNFRLFMDKAGGHFTVFDKDSGGAQWAFEIICNTANAVSRSPMGGGGDF